MNIENLIKEAFFKAVRSGGKGGQHVNKVSTKVELSFDVQNSALLTAEQKQIILKKLASKINEKGILKLTCDSERSQHSNKQLVSAKFLRLIENAFRKKKRRISSTPSKQSKEKRLKEKRKLKEKKERRNYSYKN